MKKWNTVVAITIWIRAFVGIVWLPFWVIGLEDAAKIDLIALIPVITIGYIIEMYANKKYLEARKEGRP